MGRNRPHIETFGCRLNIWESEVMREQAEQAGLTDVVIVNTCAVTSEAERQARQSIRRIRREQPDTKIVLTGCAVQIDPDSWAAMDEADHVIGNHDKLSAASWQALAQAELAPVQVSDIMDIRDTASHMLDCFDDHTRAFLQVQQGCDHRCSFCIIPYGRGPSRSVPADQVIASARHLVSSGVKEIVLTGVDMTSWGHDLDGQPKLGQLVLSLLEEVPELLRLRLSSVDPAEPDSYLMEAFSSHSRLMPHLHLSVQHGDDLILKRMKRRHLARDVIRFCEEARRRRSDIVFGADMICGFPTETDDAHHASCELVRNAGLTHLHIFGFSPREGTAAARMPQLEKSVIKSRVAELRSVAQSQLEAHLATRVGGTDMLLVENGKTGHLSGFEKAVLTDSAQAAAGDVIAVTIDGHDGERLAVSPLACQPQIEAGAAIKTSQNRQGQK